MTVYSPTWTTPAAATTDGPLFAGYFYDAETALYQVRHRYYHAELGTFVSRDPIGYAGGEGNLYRYVGGNPILGIDPSGLQDPDDLPCMYADDRNAFERWWSGVQYRWDQREPLVTDPRSYEYVDIGGEEYIITHDPRDGSYGGDFAWIFGNLYHRPLGIGPALEQGVRTVRDPIDEYVRHVKYTCESVKNIPQFPQQWDNLPQYQRDDVAINTGIMCLLGNPAVRRTVAGSGSCAPNAAQRTTLFHYTNEEELNGIVQSGELRASTKALNPNDVRYGNGQYLSDFAPGTKTPAQLSREFLGQPFQGRRFTHYVEIDVTDLNAVQGRNGVYVIPNETPLDLSGRVISNGPVPPVKR